MNKVAIRNINHNILAKAREVLNACDDMYAEIERTTKKHITYASQSNRKFQVKFQELFDLCGLADTKYKMLMTPYWLKSDVVVNLGNFWTGDKLFKQSGGYLIKDEIDIMVDIVKMIKNDYCNKAVDKIFISHSSKDKEQVQAFVKLLESVGVTNEMLFCSSVDGYDIMQGQDIYSFLRDRFIQEDLFVIFILSKNYYESTPSLNEMGATWILQKDYQSILLSDFKFEDVKGAINPMTKNFYLNNKTELTILKNRIANWFNLVIDNSQWEKEVDAFIKTIDALGSI